MIVSIIIPIYNRLEVTKQGLISLTKALDYDNLDSNKLNYEIVIVDDGSTDGSGDWIRLNYPKIHVLQGDGNLWWTGGINMGAKYAIDKICADYILLWNDDVIPDKQYFSKMNAYILNNQPLKSIVGSKICFDNNHDAIWSIGGFFNKWNGQKFAIRKQHNNANLHCHWQPGMGTLIPKFILTDLNIWWDEKRFPHYYGDSDYTLRCHKKGIPIITNLELILYNRTELTGESNAQNFKAFRRSLFSIHSFYEIRRNLMFYTRHGIIPFVYFGMIKKYIFYVASILKQKISK